MKKSTPDIDPVVRGIAEAYVARVKKGRAVKAITAMLDNGSVTTEQLSAMGYEHPPRAIADVKDNGIPVSKTMEVSAAGRRMARYFLGTAADIRDGQTGRTNFSKKFRQQLLAAYGAKDAITGATHDPRSLQIDHRVPFRVGGDHGLATDDIDAFMLLDGKSQRQKSFSCEQCENFRVLGNPDICRTCFWAFPENYSHVAMAEVRRVDIVWQAKEVLEFDVIKGRAEQRGQSVAEYLKDLGRDAVRKV